MDRRMTAIIILITLLPTATVLAANQAASTARAESPTEDASADVVARSDARTVALISGPFLAAGLAVVIGYRKCVGLYQQHCGQETGSSGAARGPAIEAWTDRETARPWRTRDDISHYVKGGYRGPVL